MLGEPVETPPEAPVINPEQLAAFVTALCKKRDLAVSGRKASGIEDDWLEDEEFYQGIDDGNRAHVRPYGDKAGRATGSTTKAVDPDGNRSVVFPNITRPYCDAGAARLADMLLPVDERCFDALPTPIAEADPQTTAQLAQLGIDWQVAQDQIQAEAKEKAERMVDAIDDLLVECGWHGEVRAVIEDSARIGAGVLKGPVPQKKTFKKWLVANGVSTLQVVSEIQPGSVRVDPWNFFPDPACGENIHDGGYTFERSYVTPKQLRDMRDMPKFEAVVIDAILDEGPKAVNSRQAGDGTAVPVEGQFEMWTFYGGIAKEDAANLNLAGETAMALLVNDKLIKVNLNALDTGEYPYDVLAWQRRPGMPWGMGIGRHIRTPQRMLVAATRAMMDNAGMIACPQIVIGNGITPADGRYEMRGRKQWRADAETPDITKQFYCYVPESMTDEFLKIVEYARSLAEQTTGMPMLLQGQLAPAGGQGADTLGGMQLLQNNATGVLRRLAKRFDDFLTEPHIRRYYNWLMQHSERDDIKGDFQIDARGSSSLIERDSQKQFMFAAMQFAKDPAYGIDPYKLFSELAKADRMDPKKIQRTEDEQKQVTGAPGPVDQSVIDLNAAKAKKELATAGETNVQGLFGATNAAVEIVTNPLIAPVADAIAQSAGVQDANAPPLIPGVPAGTPAPTPPAIPNNTHPNFPPSATTGAEAGIEGGQR